MASKIFILSLVIGSAFFAGHFVYDYMSNTVIVDTGLVHRTITSGHMFFLTTKRIISVQQYEMQLLIVKQFSFLCWWPSIIKLCLLSRASLCKCGCVGVPDSEAFVLIRRRCPGG